MKLKQQLKKEKNKLSKMSKQIQMTKNDYNKLDHSHKLLEKEKSNLENDLIELKQQYELRIEMLDNEKKQLMNNNVVKENNNLFEFNFIKFDKWCDKLNVSMSKLESNRKNNKEMAVDSEYIDFMADFIRFECAFQREKEKIQVWLLERWYFVNRKQEIHHNQLCYFFVFSRVN